MERHGDKVEVTDNEAANIPKKNHGVRWVLGISLLMAVIAMTIVWVIPALA